MSNQSQSLGDTWVIRCNTWRSDATNSAAVRKQKVLCASATCRVRIQHSAPDREPEIWAHTVWAQIVPILGSGSTELHHVWRRQFKGIGLKWPSECSSSSSSASAPARASSECPSPGIGPAPAPASAMDSSGSSASSGAPVAGPAPEAPRRGVKKVARTT